MQQTKATSREWWGLAALALPTLIVSMDVSILHLAIPHISRDLSPTTPQMLWIIDAYGFLLAAFLITMGTLGDRVGRRKLLLIGGTLFALTSMLATFAPSAEVLILARALMGISAATLMPSTLSLIMTMFHDSAQRSQAIGIWVVMFSVGAALGPVAGGFLLTFFSWRSLFLLAVPVALVLLLLGPRILPEAKGEGAPRPDMLSTILLVVGTLSFVQAVKVTGSAEPITIGLLYVLAALIIGAFIVRQLRMDTPMLDVRLLGNRALSGCLLVMTVAMFVAGGTYLFVTQYLQLVGELSPLVAGMWLVPSAVLLTITAGAAPALSLKYGPRLTVLLGLALSLVGHILIALSGPESTAQIIIGFTLAYGGGGPLIALGTDIVMNLVAPARAGSASSMSETGTELGMALGVAVLGTIGTSVYVANLPTQMSESQRADAELGLPNLMKATSDPTIISAGQSAFTDGVSVVAWVCVLLTVALMAMWVFTIPRSLRLEEESQGQQEKDEAEIVP